MMYTDKYNSSLSICSYLRILIKEDQGKILSSKEIAYRQKFNEQFGNLDIELYKQFYAAEQNNDFNSVDVLKDIYSELLDETKKVHDPNTGKNYSALIELLKASKHNIDFSIGDTENKAPRSNSEEIEELFEIVNEFHGRTYLLTNDVAIKLTSKEFMHIAIGHIERYQIPRKGKMMAFDFINHWEHLLSFIEIIILDFLKQDLIDHFSNGTCEYNNTNIKIGDKHYGIHIGKGMNIKTFYQIAS